MKSHSLNPDENQLPPGVELDRLTEAVRESGYPLQTVVAKQLAMANGFTVVEEWGYLDRTTKEHRALDVFAFRKFGDSTSLAPNLALLVECKRSSTPVVFFTPAVPQVPEDFPTVCGLREEHFYLQNPEGRSINVSPAKFLCAREFPFVGGVEPSIATTFARLERKGKAFAVSGEVPYKEFALPLVSALDHCQEVFRSSSTTLFPTVTLCVGVIDAAMIVVRGTPEEPELELDPWVRLVRQESVQTRFWGRRHYVIDFVHRAFFSTFLAAHVIPFADAIATRVSAQEQLVRLGRANVADWDDFSWKDLRRV